MSSVSPKSVQVHQLLFGYDQGHRLIAGSVKPPDVLKRQLSQISDSPGGSPLYPDASVLRGIPLPQTKTYALMRTWPATDARARPGTVWTHVLLVDPPDLGRDGIILQLVRQFQNPETGTDLGIFNKPLVISQSLEDIAVPDWAHGDLQMAKALLIQLYGEPGAPLKLRVLDEPQLFGQQMHFSEIEELVVTLWEQQWPRLRRSFSFMIGPWSGFDQNSMFRSHDLVIGFIRSPFVLSFSATTPSARWLEVLIEDLQKPGLLRRFLRRAGADVKEPLRSVRDLVELYLLFAQSTWSRETYTEIFEKTFASFMGSEEAKWLKERLIDDVYWSRLPNFQVSEYVDVLLAESRAHDLSPLNMDLSSVVQRLLRESPDEAQRLALLVFEDDTLPLAERFLVPYLTKANDNDLRSLVKVRPTLLHALIQRMPQLLERDVLWQALPERRDSLLARLLALPEDQSKSLDWNLITEQIVSASDQGLSHDLIRQLPDEIVKLLLDLLKQQENPKLYEAWYTSLNARADVVIDWIAESQAPPVDLLLWVCRYLDERHMWSDRLDPVWLGVGYRIDAYPASEREELATHVLCILVRDLAPDVRVLLNILELAREHLRKGGLSFKHESFFHDHLPRLKKSEDDWDLCRRLDKWVSEVFQEAGISKRTVLNYFKEPSLAERLWRYLKKR